MKDKIKKILTIIFIVFAVLFGFSWVKSCNNAENIKTYTNVAQTRQKAVKRANENERISINMIFDSTYIDKIVNEEFNETYTPNENGQIIIDFYSFQASRDYILDIYFKNDIAYLYTTSDWNVLNNAFNFSNYDYFSSPWEYNLGYPSSKLTFEYYEEELENTTTTQNTYVTLNSDFIRHNFNYLTNKSIILNSSLSSQFGDNLINITNTNVTDNDCYNGSLSLESGTYTINLTSNENNGAYQIFGYYNGVQVPFDVDTQYKGESLTFTINSQIDKFRIYCNSTNTDIRVMLNKGSIALPYYRYIDISDNHDKVQLLNNNSNLNNIAFANYFFSNNYKSLINRYDYTPLIELRNNSLAFAIGTGTQTTLQQIYDYNNNLYLNAYGLVPRTLNFTNQFNHNNLECAVLDNYSNGESSYQYEIFMTEYLLNNSQPFTTEQIDTYNIGYQIGKSDGIYQATEWTNIINVLASSIDNILNIQILPNITIKILILVPLMFAILSFIVKTFIR